MEPQEDQVKKKHLMKAITWRIIASLTSFGLGWWFTGNVESGLKIGVADVIIKFLLYYYHERIWYKYTKIKND